MKRMFGSREFLHVECRIFGSHAFSFIKCIQFFMQITLSRRMERCLLDYVEYPLKLPTVSILRSTQKMSFSCAHSSTSMISNYSANSFTQINFQWTKQDDKEMVQNKLITVRPSENTLFQRDRENETHLHVDNKFYLQFYSKKTEHILSPISFSLRLPSMMFRIVNRRLRFAHVCMF